MLRRYSVHGMETLPLEKTVITIGSSSGCDITLSDPNLAEKHAEIEYHPLPQAYFLKDLDTLSGTTLNGEPVYGKVELKPNNAIRFGYGPEYVFELPKSTCKPTIKKVLKGHENCILPKDASISLPIVGVKERKILPAIPAKNSSHHPPRPRKVRLHTENGKSHEEKEKKLFLTTDKLSPISRVRSASIDPSVTRGIPKPKRHENGRSTVKLYGTPSPTSSANSSVDLPSNRRNTILGTPLNDYTQSTNNNLLQRVVRLQMELHRRDLEINQLRDRILNVVPADPSRIAFPFPDPVMHTEVPKLLEARSPSELGSTMSPQGVHRSLSPHIHDSAHVRTMEMGIEIRTDFLKLLAKSLQSFNDRLLTFPMRDYADIFSEMTRCLIEPISYTVAETEKQCVENINKRYMLISERQVAHQLLEKYTQESIQPLIKQIEMILPVVRDAALIARESVKVCTVFTAWSREFGDEIRTNGLTSNMLLNKADALLSRFKENSLGKHWLPPSLTPLLRVASLEFRKRIESRTVGTKEPISVESQTEHRNNSPVASSEGEQESRKKTSAASGADRIQSAESRRPVDAKKAVKEAREGTPKAKSESEEEIHNASTAPPSACSSQKTSTDSEQLSQLHELAKTLTSDVFEKLMSDKNKNAEEDEDERFPTPRASGDHAGSYASSVPTPPSTPVPQVPAYLLHDAPSLDANEQNSAREEICAVQKEQSTEEDSLSSASHSLPTVIAKDIEVIEPDNEDSLDDVPFPESMEIRKLGDDPDMLKMEQSSLNLNYMSDLRSDASSRLSHRLEHHTELDEPDDKEYDHKRKESSEFWRLATNLGKALALEHEIDKTRNEKTDESDKRSSVMESLMVGIHEILENIKTEHERLEKESKKQK